MAGDKTRDSHQADIDAKVESIKEVLENPPVPLADLDHPTELEQGEDDGAE